MLVIKQIRLVLFEAYKVLSQRANNVASAARKEPSRKSACCCQIQKHDQSACHHYSIIQGHDINS